MNDYNTYNIEQLRQEALELRRQYMSEFFSSLGKKMNSVFISELRVSKSKALELKAA